MRPAYNFNGHEGEGPAKCQHCPDEAYGGCADGLCPDCCAKNGRDNGDGFACEDCRVELAAREADTRRIPAARTGPFTVDHIVCCDICHRANLRRGMFHVVGYTTPVCARCVSELRESEAALR